MEKRSLNHLGAAAILLLALWCSSPVEAQDSLRTSITYQVTTEAALGTGDYTAFQLAANRHHVLSTRPNTAYLRGSVSVEQPLSAQFVLSGAVDVIGAVHADHKAYLQQCYANLSSKSFYLEVGSREDPQVIRDDLLSIGSFVKGTNAKPVPQVRFGTNGFWTVPYTKQWLQIDFSFGYGKFMDSSYREDCFWKASDVNSFYTTGSYYHQKHLYFRSNPEKLFFAVVGIEHAVQFGGTNHWLEQGELVEKTKPTGLKDFLDVILPLGDSHYYENNAEEDWVYGNHVGVMTYQLGWNIDRHHQLQAYLDNPFEDGSGIRKGNGWDGLWGVQYTNKTSGRQYVRGAVLEYFQSTNQSGPLHWDPGDYPEPVRSQITDMVTGNDDYYNHFFFGGYSHYGMTFGVPLITSPIYNKDGYTCYRDNRIKAWHAGINGELTDRLSYLVKGSYREGWGTYNDPLPVRHHSFDALIQAMYAQGPWHVSAAYAFDKGNIYGDCSTFDLKISYHGKIL